MLAAVGEFDSIEFLDSASLRVCNSISFPPSASQVNCDIVAVPNSPFLAVSNWASPYRILITRKPPREIPNMIRSPIRPSRRRRNGKDDDDESEQMPFLVRQLSGHTGHVFRLAALSETLLCSASQDRTMRVWNVRDGKCLATLDVQNRKKKQRGVRARSGTSCMLQDPFNQSLFEAGGRTKGVRAVNDCGITVWDLTRRSVISQHLGHAQVILALSHCTSASKSSQPVTTLVSGSLDTTVKLWDFKIGGGVTAVVRTWRCSSPVIAVSCLSDVNLLLATSVNGEITAWDIRGSDLGSMPEPLWSIRPYDRDVDSRYGAFARINRWDVASIFNAGTYALVKWSARDGKIKNQSYVRGSGLCFISDGIRSGSRAYMSKEDKERWENFVEGFRSAQKDERGESCRVSTVSLQDGVRLTCLKCFL